MLDKIVHTVLQGTLKEGMNKKLNIQSNLIRLAKKYGKYLVIAMTIALIIIILLIWLAWSLISGAISSGKTIIPDTVVPHLQKVEEVGINGIIEQPINFLQDIWYGKDGK